MQPVRSTSRPATRATTAGPSLDVVRKWVDERLRWERFLTEAVTGSAGPAAAAPTPKAA